jgi:Zn-finger nucleic acid-binding protein
MQCPACGNELLPEMINNTTFHICDGGCGGVWFERQELENWNENSTYNETHLTVKKETCPSLNQSKRYICPTCESIIMQRRYLDTIEDVLVDECSSCGGFWLNGDDLEEMHSQMDLASFKCADELESASLTLQNREKYLIAACHGLCPCLPVG